MSKSEDKETIALQGSCPICLKPKVYAYRPFCSQRCKDIDLGRWIKGTYAIPVKEDDEDTGKYEE